MGNLSGESREQNRKDKVTRFPSVTYACQLGLSVNTLGSHLKRSVFTITKDNNISEKSRVTSKNGLCSQLNAAKK